MKRLKQVALGVILSFAGCIPAMAGEFPQLVANSSGTSVTVWVTPTPALLVSTGSNVQVGGKTPSFFINRGTSTLPVAGDYMTSRNFIEIFNDSAVDIFVGYNANVSSQTGINRGRRIPAQASWSHDCSIEDHWAIAGSSTGHLVTVTQER